MNTKTKIAIIFFKYTAFYSKNISYSDVYDYFWNQNFDSRDPDSGWGTRIHKTIFPLYGDNLRIVPSDSKGYLMDSTCNANTWDGNAYSFTTIYKKSVKKSDVLIASVYCYLSKDFDGEWAALVSEGANKEKFQVVSSYDISKKGMWQKLSLIVNCADGDISILLYFSKFGVTDFSTLNGHVIYAYPKLDVVNYLDSASSYFERKESLIISNVVNAIDLKTIKKNRFSDSENSNIKNNDSFLLRDRDSANSLLLLAKNSMVSNKSVITSTFKIDLSSLLFIMQKSNDQDPIRKMVSKIISEDTIYYANKDILHLDTISDRLFGDRLTRWKFSMQIFTNEYNWSKKIFGGGFNFLNWYGYYFGNDKTRSDYPHNPFLSVLLYSGIFGLIIYLIFMYKVFFYYIKYRKEYPLLFIFFLITFFFSFFSAGSPFDPPIMGFFVILPFFIHSIHKREQKLTESEIPELHTDTEE